MHISINPTITGGFVYHVMADKEVAKHIKKLKLTDEEAHNFAKAVLIAGMRDIEIDFNKTASRRVDQVLDKVLEEEVRDGK
jgi:hypothetical protein